MAEFLSSVITWQLIISVAVIVIIIHMLLGLAGLSTYAERKISAYIQDRIGPNRTGLDLGLPALSFLKGLFGLGQFLADGIKFIIKEDYTPRGADRFLFSVAAVIVVVPALIMFLIIPWGGKVEMPALSVFGWFTIQAQTVHIAGANLSVGIVYLLAIASLGIYAVTLAGWSSNNKYAFIGGLRASAQMISYEIPMGIAILVVLLMTGSLLPDRILNFQADHGWLIFTQPVMAVVFYICLLAEGNRVPFDNAECEQELVGGYHTEYSAMRMALFMLSEYIHLVTGAAFFSLLFLGGYHLPATWVSADPHHWLHPENTTWMGVIAKFHVFLGKTLLMVFAAMIVRWTIPRLKFNQVMGMAWNGLIPLSIAVLLIVSVMVAKGWTAVWQMALMNVAVAALFVMIAPNIARATRNRKLRIAGSRFSPLLGEEVVTGVTNPMARSDRPVGA